MTRSLWILLSAFTILQLCSTANILMITLGGSKSHKIPFWELARGLIPRGHNITFISGFPAEFHMQGLEEITSLGLYFYFRNFTNWDLIGARVNGATAAFVVPLRDVVRYPVEVCDLFLKDPETMEIMRSPRNYDLMILDGAYPECIVGLAYHFNTPFMFINTVGFYSGSLSFAGNPAPYSVTPFFTHAFTDKMTLLERMYNTGLHVIARILHAYTITQKVDPLLRRTFGENTPSAYDMIKNVSFTLQNGYASVSYARAYLPNVAEIACIHCKPAKPLPKDLEDFVNDGGDAGFIYVSMGSAVKSSRMPEVLRRMLLRVFEQLPYKVIWKWEANMDDLPDNVKIGKWLPQQDLLGHKKILVFITHGGLNSIYETVYHGVPIVALPIQFDHESASAKSKVDGYAIKLELSTVTSDILLESVKTLINDPKYKNEVKKNQLYIRDQKETPLERAIFWTEYVLRHKDVTHLQSPSKDMNLIVYYSVDVFVIYIVALVLLVYYCRKIFYYFWSKYFKISPKIKRK